MKKYPFILFLLVALLGSGMLLAQPAIREKLLFDDGWRFLLGNDSTAKDPGFQDASWRLLNLPHDWSIELPFDKNSPAGTGGGALNGGIGWYRKTFQLNASHQFTKTLIRFDGVYRNSEVWINGHYLGKRPNGYISFEYELTPFLKYGKEQNALAVKVNNADQPNSRWYSGSGIYRNVYLLTVQPLHIATNGTYITTPKVEKERAAVQLNIRLQNSTDITVDAEVQTNIYDADSRKVAAQRTNTKAGAAALQEINQSFQVSQPLLWSVDHPYLYKAVTEVFVNGKKTDTYTTPFGIRYFYFDADKGFFLNDRHVKIRGVCDHHDLGCLGTAINTRALERQLQILKGMGCNAIRTSHNPPAPELLELADKMGFIIMDEAFDMWKKPKNPFDYHLDWDEWHVKDLTDQLLRDRNHPSVFIWSIGNEIPEQWGGNKDTSGKTIIRELVGIVKSIDPTRPTVTANNEIGKGNTLLQAGATDLVGYNYHHEQWADVQEHWGRKPFIVTESVSALETRGHYDLLRSDSIRRWPERWDLPVKHANADLTCSAYDNVSAPWGSTHEETLKVFEKYDHVSGMFIWTGFDYMGEPTPYPWPARSSYFGVIDLAGFPKDVYYLYRSVWTNEPVLHILPHWNWKRGDTVDVWAYYNNADQVELFVNGKSAGVRKKQTGELHVVWRVKYEPGMLKAVSAKNGKTVLVKKINTAAAPAKISLTADRKTIHADGKDLSFITVKIEDAAGNLVPDAANLVHFDVQGGGTIAGVDNGSETSMESFKAIRHKAFNGLCLLVVQAKDKRSTIRVKATAEGLTPAAISIEVQ
ncbi:MAG: beta-galactosidase GalB [Sediminibacterium sp.]